jgi:hypothetical protein
VEQGGAVADFVVSEVVIKHKRARGRAVDGRLVDHADHCLQKSQLKSHVNCLQGKNKKTGQIEGVFRLVFVLTTFQWVFLDVLIHNF